MPASPEAPSEPSDVDLTEDTEALSPADLEQIDDPYPQSEPVSYTGTDFDVDGLVRRLKRKDMIIPTFGHGDSSIESAGFQRDFVWRRPQMDRFIESLLLGFPVPGIFLVQQRDKRYLVLDGQQRLRTLVHFYEGTFGKRVFELKSVQESLQGKTYHTLEEHERRTLDNTFIQAIVVKTDGSTESLEAIYQIFERLNSGGTQLTAHEIRVALYAGPLIDFIADLNKRPVWRALYGNESPRLRDQELLLRILALYAAPGVYKRPLKQFLNTFAGQNRDCKKLSTAGISTAFDEACKAFAVVGSEVLRNQGRQVNAALTEALMVAMMNRLTSTGAPTPAGIRSALAELQADRDFAASIGSATADEEQVRTRLAKATQAIARAP